MKTIDGFHLDDDATLYNQIQFQLTVYSLAAVMQWHMPVPFHTKPTVAQLDIQAFVVNRLEQPRTESCVYFDGGAYDPSREVVKRRFDDIHALSKSMIRAVWIS